MNFIFRDVWLLSTNNNTLGQICSNDLRGSSCGEIEKSTTRVHMQLHQI